MALRENNSPGSGFIRRDIKSYPAVIAAATVDADNTGQTHELVGGLMLGTITATKKLTQYDDAASDGSQVCTHILNHYVDMKDGDPNGTAVDQTADVIEEGVVSKKGLRGWDAAASVDLAGKIKITDD